MHWDSCSKGLQAGGNAYTWSTCTDVLPVGPTAARFMSFIARGASGRPRRRRAVPFRPLRHPLVSSSVPPPCARPRVCTRAARPGNRAGDGRGRGCRTAGGDVVAHHGGGGRGARRRRAPPPLPRRRRAGAARVVQGGAAWRGAARAAAAGGDGVARRRRHVGLPPRLQVRQARRLRRLLHPPVSNPNPVPALSPLRINAGHSHLSAVIVLVLDSCCPLYP